MSEYRTEQFATPSPVTLRVIVAAGDVEVRTEATTTSTVEVRSNNATALEQTRVELQGDVLLVQAPERALGLLRRDAKIDVTVVLPEESAVQARLAAADLRVHGRLGWLEAGTASGDVQADDITGDVKVRSASGDLALGHAGGAASVHSTSGDIALRGAGGDIDAQTASGDIALGDAGGSVRASSASGDVAIGVARRGTVEINSASGDVAVGVASGVGVWLDVSTMSGSTSTDLDVGEQPPPSGADLRLTARTMSGDVQITRALSTQS